MSLLSNVKSDASVSSAVEEDSTGPVYVVDSGVYDCVIDMAYVMQSQSSKALGINLKLKTREGTMITERIWFTNKSGQTFYTRDGQNVPLPGFAQMNSLCNLVVGKNFLDLQDDIETKQVMIYNREERKEVGTDSEVVVPLVGRKIKAGILREYQDVGDANNNWKPTGYSRDVNTVDKFFDFDSSQTQGEKIENKPASYIEKWIARNEGVTRDKTENKVGFNPKPKDDAPARSNVRSTATEAPAKPQESLFTETASADDDIPF